MKRRAMPCICCDWFSAVPVAAVCRQASLPLQAASAKTEAGAGGKSKKKKKKAKVSCHVVCCGLHLSAALLESKVAHHLQGGMGHLQSSATALVACALLSLHHASACMLLWHSRCCVLRDRARGEQELGFI